MSFILTVTEPDGGVALRVTGACACFSTPESAVEPVEAPLIQGRPVLGHVVLENRARCKGRCVHLKSVCVRAYGCVSPLRTVLCVDVGDEGGGKVRGGGWGVHAHDS